jgi:hypothetical protein
VLSPVLSAFGLGEMGASEIQLRCYPVRSLCNRPLAVLRTPSSRAFSGEMIEKASASTETLGCVWRCVAKQEPGG